ncbi:MAG TPA: PAS domain-containing protein, partial [Candidatus Brocadiaceae bacterium]
MIPHSIKIENILDNIVDALNAGFTLLDKNMNVIWANEQLSLMLNLKYNPVGRTCREVYSCECQDIEHCFAFQAFSSGKKQYSETQLITEKGERRYIHNITIPVKGDDNRITYLVKLSTDITVKEEKIHQLLLLRKLVELMQGTSQIESLLHLILTCVTAGTALGFNRA